MRISISMAVLVLAVITGATLGQQPDVAAEDEEYFERRVRPLLAKHCYTCHSTGADKLQASLLVDSRQGLVRGGDSGPAIVPGQPDKSLLMTAVRYESFEMPPDRKLSESEIQILEQWIRRGAPWPNSRPTPDPVDKATPTNWQQVRASHWAWQPVAPVDIPQTSGDWPRNPIDHFVLTRLQEAGLDPAPPASDRQLVRRLFLNLTGLPPTPTDLQSFPADASRDREAAIRQLVNKLLDSPQYGERWGRHWLDVARYSDGQGGFLDNAALDQAWRYRDWVVQALNDDMPYDKFLQLQIAGDLLGDRDDAIATGFFALGPTYRSDGGDPDSKAQAQSETLDDRMDTLGRGLLGITVACARCHDHKFDPIPQHDYYALAGVFNNTSVFSRPLAPPDVVAAFDQHRSQVQELQKQINQLQTAASKAKRELDESERQQITQWEQELATVQQNTPPAYDTAHTLRDAGQADMHVAIRGNLRRPGELAPRRFLRVLEGESPTAFSEGSGRRQLAMAVTNPNNPLTARVFVNRVWMHHFGHALVRSPSNFGTLGEAPTHPLLLDWLALEFMRSGWSLKTLHRLIVSSRTYQMSSNFDAHAYSLDGDNRLLWRMNPRRLDVESWRDSLLFVTGELDPSTGGPPTEDLTGSRRRTLYAKVSRNGDRFRSDEFLRRFDFPLMRATVAQRPTTIVPQQYLFLMNSQFMVERARALRSRLVEAADNDRQRILEAYRRLFGRHPSPREIELGMQFLATADAEQSEQAESDATNARPESEAGRPDRWVQYAQVLLSSNEFMYVR